LRPRTRLCRRRLPRGDELQRLGRPDRLPHPPAPPRRSPDGVATGLIATLAIRARRQDAPTIASNPLAQLRKQLQRTAAYAVVVDVAVDDQLIGAGTLQERAQLRLDL